MNERLLQFIWQNRLFNEDGLLLETGEPLTILHPGTLNTNQGPDFSDARIRIHDTVWAGNIELHIHSSDWYRHAHESDMNYRNVILHAVWQHDMPGEEARIPLLILGGRVPKLLLGRYEEWMNCSSFIPCGSQLGQVNDLVWLKWKESLMLERLIRKCGIVNKFLEENNQHWEETCWWLLARNFGMRVNAEPFEMIARSLPVSLLARQKSMLICLEALLLGQGGLLNGDFKDDYPRLLQREYWFLRNKYGLKPIDQPLFFLRMRPENFPSVRLAQLARLIAQSTHLFSRLKNAASLVEVEALFEITANDYWHYHYLLDEGSSFKPKHLGKAMRDNIIINTVIPILFAYGYIQKEDAYMNKALDWMTNLPPEKNSLTAGFEKLAVSNRNAGESQALAELKSSYCEKKRCLECAAGHSILRKLA